MQKLRVTIPTRKRDLIMLAQKVLSKHQLDAENSKLNVLDWQDVATKIQQATAMHDEAEELSRKSRLVNEQRDQLLGELERHVRNSRDVLTGVFKNEMKILGAWGYDVIEMPRSARQKKEVKEVN